MELDDNMQQKQEQEEHQQWLMEQTRLKLMAMSDEEFFMLLGNIEQEVRNVSL